MGEMAEGLLNGDFDEQTGEWLGKGDGFPRTMEPGYYNSIVKKKTRKRINPLQNRFKQVMEHYVPNSNTADRMNILRKFAKLNKLEYKSKQWSSYQFILDERKVKIAFKAFLRDKLYNNFKLE